MEQKENNKNVFTIEKPMPPLWMMHPYIHRYSIGWRMGYGEGYRNDLFDWKETLTEEEKKQYKEMFPAPKTWRGHYNEEEEDDDNDDSDDINEYFYKTVEFRNNRGEMQYSRSRLLTEICKGSKPEFVFFQQETLSCLNTWQYTEFELDMDNYRSLGQYIAAEKARFFEDKKREKQIMQSQNREEIESLEKQIRNFDPVEWDKVKYSIALNGNYLKFSQNNEIRDFLLATENKVLIYTDPIDKIWGIGINEPEKATDPNCWQGENLSGFTLMEVREEIRNVYKNYDKIDWSLLGE